MPIPAPGTGGTPGIGLFFVHSCAVETFVGSGAYGPVYAASVAVDHCFIDDDVHLVRDAVGEEVASNATVYAPAGQADLFAVGSRVALNGRMAYVIATKFRTSGPLGLPDHVEAHLT